MAMSPNILDLFYPVTATTVVCCILMQILCVVAQKKLKLLGETPYRGSAPGPRWGTFVPQTFSLLLCPPNNPVRSTPLPVPLPKVEVLERPQIPVAPKCSA